MEHVQSLEKGLEILALLNRAGEASVSQVSVDIGIPRTTALRLLETLRNLGYVDRDTRSKRFRLTIKVHTLADGYDDEQWILDIARPWVKALSRDLVWSLLIATPLGISMLWRENTDRTSPLALSRYAAGFRVPTVRSASGHVFLAYCRPEERKSVLDLVAASKDSRSIMLMETLDRKLELVRREGYAIFTRKHDREAAISVPVLSRDRYLASLTMRYIYGSMTQDQVVENYFPVLRNAADKIGEEFLAKATTAERIS